MQRRTGRQTRWLGLAVVGALVLAACGGDDGGEPSASDEPTAPSATEGQDATDATDATEATEAPTPTDSVGDTGVDSVPVETVAREFEPTTLTMWGAISDQEGIDAFRPILDRCEADHPWLTIDYVGKDDMATALSAAVEAGEPPDLVQADFSGNLAAIEAGGLIEPVDELAARDGVDWDAFVPAGVKLVEFNGQRYGLPFSLDSVGLFCNQDILSEVGIDAPPATFDELLTAAGQLLVTNDDGSIERAGFVPDVGDGSYALYMTDMFGATLYSDDGATITITDTLDQWVEALRWQKEFYDLMDADEFTRWADGLGSYDSADNFFIAGQLPLYFEGSYFVTWPERFGNGQPENWGVVPMPGPDGVDADNAASLIPSGNWFMIPTGVADVEASWAATRCMALAADEIATFQELWGNVPANIAALDEFEAVTVARIPEFQTFIDLARSSAARVPGSSVVGGALSDELTSLVLDYRRGDISDDDLPGELEDLAARYQEELDLELGN